ncbi:MAG: CsgG/HfaB family protein [Acidobacteriaceae bacterium]|nr:CsgG/HfaB family protein [Acidobacteriaceae bacterium]
MAVLLAVAPARAQSKGGSAAKGAAGTNGGVGDNGLEHCDKPMGAIAVVEPQSQMMAALSQQGLQSPVSVIRMMIQQSNCFIVVERGTGMQNVMQERQLAAAGQTRAGSNMGGGQMVSADFVLTPSVVFSENNAGGIGAAAGGLLGGKAGAIAGGLKFKEAQTSMLISDSRSGVQVAAAEGSTKKADLNLSGGLLGSSGGASVGGYGNTNEGKLILASFVDNYNKIVGVVRNDPSLQRNVGTLAQEAAAGGARKSGAVFDEGEVITPKIANVKMYVDASETGKVAATLGRGEELVVIGGEKDGFIQVQSGSASGWVKIVLMQKR